MKFLLTSAPIPSHVFGNLAQRGQIVLTKGPEIICRSHQNPGALFSGVGEALRGVTPLSGKVEKLKVRLSVLRSVGIDPSSSNMHQNALNIFLSTLKGVRIKAFFFLLGRSLNRTDDPI